MKILLLGSANSIHTLRWVRALQEEGLKVVLATQHDVGDNSLPVGVKYYRLPFSGGLGYFTNAIRLIQILRLEKPDILNAHYATGYGLLARMSGFKPLMMSVWGSDVYEFPEKSFFHRLLLKGNLEAATSVGSTSHCMARKTAQTYDHPHVFVTPFGVDEKMFAPVAKVVPMEGLVIGTVKTLKATYGIDTLIEAFALAKHKMDGTISLTLEISGTGPDLHELQALAQRLGVDAHVVFHGPVPHDRVPEMLNRLDIYVALSRSESFGVAILEACACEKPVVVSDADGLAEVTVDAVTGFIVPRNNPAATADAILKLVHSAELRQRMGRSGRTHVLTNYAWVRSVDLMLDAYRSTIALHRHTDKI